MEESNKNSSLTSGGRECQFIKDDGTKCKAQSIRGSNFCFFHENNERVRLAAKKGGEKGRRKVLNSSDLSLRSITDVIGLLETTTNEIRRGDLDRGIGNTIGYLAGILIKALETGDVEERLGNLEKLINQRIAS